MLANLKKYFRQLSTFNYSLSCSERLVKSSLLLLISAGICLVLLLKFSTHSCTPHPASMPSMSTQTHPPDCGTLQDLEMLDDMGSRSVSLLLHPKCRVVIQPKLDWDANVSIPLLIMVNSLSASEERRDHIRSSWGKWTKPRNIKVLFFAGIPPRAPYYQDELKKLTQENEAHGDLVIIEFDDSYYRLSLKMLRLLEWYTTTFATRAEPAFFLKTDDDVFLNIPRIMGLLSSNKTSQGVQENGYFVAGRVYDNPAIETNCSSKYFISAKFWLRGKSTSTYPSYVEGPCVILSGNLGAKILAGARSVPLFPFEDVYITGMVLGERLGMNKFTNVTTYNDYSLRKLGDGEVMREAFAIHPVYDPELMVEIFKSYVEA